MNKPPFLRASLAASVLALAMVSTLASAQSRVQYGRVTNVAASNVNNTSAQNVGTLVGGGIGLASGRNQSGSNRALRTVGGAAAGRGVATLATRSQSFEYTVAIVGGGTVRIVSDQAGKQIGDCVAVEQGQFSNIRLVADARCNPPARAAAPAAAPAPVAVAAAPADVEAASACDQAKAQVLAAETDEAFALAERRMRLLCGE